MANIDDEDDIRDDLIGSDDYEVIPRPQELIEIQKRSSSKPKSFTGSDSSIKVVGSKRDSKTKEKRSSKKHERKSSSKTKPLYKSPLAESSPKQYIAEELDNKFESFVQNAKTSVYKYKSEFSKLAVNEPSDTTGSKNKLPDINTKQDLGIEHSKIMDEPAIIPLDRFKVLDARDNAIRLSNTKQGGSKKTKITGTCPDMCPEKERYSRIAKNCLSILEMTTVFDQNATSRDANHSYMVKEYSRSSADQQEPLPHELRPISVLMFTMDYLICNIMDLPLNNISLADWYDFIWNRTRSIRKDITQQQLCDIQCVEIIEKCVRFHIHCAEALSEEEAATFDPKINNENLTKCLQTLKHMYHDLLSKGIHCPNEAEFRSYDILLSLTEGETLRLIKDIRKDLLKSPLIKLAFNASLAFKSHNYVKFFNLIYKANYLSSCILHRYILEARVRALQIIVRAYSTQHISSMYPTANLMRDLKFESAAEASDFCRCHGLEADDTFINIERRQYTRSASALPLSRSFLLVGSKMGKSLGKVINSGKLPPNPLHWYKPHNSFDERNILKVNSLGSVLKRDDELSKESLPLSVPVPSAFIKPQVQISVPTAFQSFSAEPKLMPQTSISVFQPFSSEPKTLPSSGTFLIPPSNVKFSFLEKQNDPDSIHSKKDQFSDSQFDFFRNALMSNFSSLNENAYEEQFGPQSETEAKHFEIETENQVDKEQLSESSNDVVMEEAEEITEQDSSHAVFNENTEFGKTDESLPLPRMSSEFFSKVPLHFPEREKSLSPKENSSPHPIFTNIPPQITRTEKSLSPKEKTSPQLDEVEYPEAENELDILKFIGDSNSSFADIPEVVTENDTNDIEKNENEMEGMTEDLLEKILAECFEECSASICEEVLKEERSQQAQYEKELEIFRRNVALRTILKWKYFCERKHQRRMFENSTFCSPWQSMLLNTPYLTTGATNPVSVYKKHCSLSRLTAKKIKKSKEIFLGWEEFKAEDIWPLKSFRPYPSAYFGKSGIKFFFKLCVVFPPGCLSSDVITFMNWICAKFSLRKTQNFKFDAVNSSLLHNTWILHNGRSLVCVTVLQLGHHSRSNYVKFLHGVTAMIMFFPPYSEDCQFCDEFSTLLDSDTLQYPYPLFVYFLKSEEKSSKLLSFLHDKLEASYFTQLKTECLPEIKSFETNSEKIKETLNWLLEVEKKEFSHPWLLKCSFIYYLEDSFAFAFNILLCKISLEEFKCLKEMPKYIIKFYNKVLKFRASVLCSELLERIHSSWPPKEVISQIGSNFIDPEAQRKCKEKMEHLLLPNLNEESLGSSSIWDYVKHVASLACRDKEMLFIRVKQALENPDSQSDWLNIINMCALHLIHALNSELSLSSKDFPVFYTKDDLETFDSDEYWMKVSSEIRSILNLNCTKRKLSSLDSPVKKKKWDQSVDIASRLNVILEHENLITSAFDMPDIFDEQRKHLFEPLKTAVAKQLEQSDAFLNQLNKSVQNFDCPAVSFADEEFLGDRNVSDCQMSSVGSNVYSFKDSPSSRLNFDSQLNSNLLDISIKDSNQSSVISLADKISELKYNIQKSNIIEDHFSQLLSKQL